MPEDEPVYPRFYYPAEKKFTGLIQFRADVGDRTGIEGLGYMNRGQVIRVKNEQFAYRAVRGGYFAHVAAGTPEGQPEEYKPKKATPTAAVQTDENPE